jgi:phage-related protein
MYQRVVNNKDLTRFSVHAFVKKSQETPEHDLKIARKRMKEVQNG